nr:MAG TPA: hypothetical protein [Caudoviricetes sp.]
MKFECIFVVSSPKTCIYSFELMSIFYAHL